MSTKLNDTQLVLLRAAAQRDDHCLVAPTGPKRSPARRAIAKLLEARLVKEIKARKEAPIWRRDEETGHSYALKLTAAGLTTIAGDERRSFEEAVERNADHRIGLANAQPKADSNPEATVRPDSVAAQIPMSPRSGTKIAAVIALLQRGAGASLAELVVATGWLPHTTRAALTGLRKRGYAIVIDRTVQPRGSVYRIESTEMSSDNAARPDQSTLTEQALPDYPERSASPRSRQAA
jgi:Protein of unknown function (DUF3489)